MVAAFVQVWPSAAQTKTPPDLSGVYQAIASGTTLPGGLRNEGAPEDVAVRPGAVDAAPGEGAGDDPEKQCQPIGPFRMMARENLKFEFVPVLARGMVVMLFEDVSHGYMRTLFLNRDHPAKPEPSWQGDSVGRWEGDTLVVDTLGFNERTWLNAEGVQHSEALRLVERYRPILGGGYLEYLVTAEDPAVLAKPFSYRRYFKKLDTEIMEDVCEE
jgi:hypothetical protein